MVNCQRPRIYLFDTMNEQLMAYLDQWDRYLRNRMRREGPMTRSLAGVVAKQRSWVKMENRPKADVPGTVLPDILYKGVGQAVRDMIFMKRISDICKKKPVTLRHLFDFYKSEGYGDQEAMEKACDHRRILVDLDKYLLRFIEKVMARQACRKQKRLRREVAI